MERQMKWVQGSGFRVLCIMLLYALSAMPAIAQRRVNLHAIIYLDKDVNSTMNAHVVQYLTTNLNAIASVHNETLFLVPIEREYKKNVKSIIIEGYLAQYSDLPNDIDIKKIKTKYVEFDFSQKKIKIKSKNDDDGMFDVPLDLKQKIKDKEKKIKKEKPL